MYRFYFPFSSLKQTERQDSIAEALQDAEKLGLCNIKELLLIINTAPVTGCEAERSFSALSYIKDDLRNSMTTER